MKSIEPRICVGEPRSFVGAEIDDFVAFVLTGGVVTAKGLRNRVRKASQIAFAREDERLLGVGGIMKPATTYRGRIARNAGVELPRESIPFELGWVFVLPSARGRGLSTAICRARVALAGGSGNFASARKDNEAMHGTLRNVGFTRLGNEWMSKENNTMLALFTKDAV